MVDDRVVLYVSEREGRRISVVHARPDTGELTRVQQVPVAGKVMPMAVTPDCRGLFAAIRSEPYQVASFSIAPADGTLTHLGDMPVAESLVHLSVDRTGRFLLGACNTHDAKRRSGLVTVNPIGVDGCVGPAGMVVRTPPKTHAIIADPANRFAVATSCDGDVILRFAFDPVLGELNPDGLAPVLVTPRSGPRHLRFRPDGRFLYLVNEYDASVWAYRYGAPAGSLVEIQTVSARPPDYAGEANRAADLHFTPDGRWLYVSVRGSLTLAVFRVDPATGRLSSAGHFPTVDEPRGFCIDPLGRCLFVPGFRSGCLVAYRIDAETGALRQLAELAMGDEPNWIEAVMLPQAR